MITNNIYSDEWYTDKETALRAIGILSPSTYAPVLCPFDSEKSEFVKILQNMGHPVYYGMTDFLDKPAGYYPAEYIVTNPPFSIKDQVIAKVYEYGIPATLILPLDVMGGVKRHALYAKHGQPEFYIPTRRIHYYDEMGQLRKGSSFHSIIATFNRDKGTQLELSTAVDKGGTPYDFVRENDTTYPHA